MNSFVEKMEEKANMTLTANGAVARKSTMNKVYDLFARGGAMRGASESDCLLLFKEAYEEDALFGLKTLFYLRDVRGGGQGERRFFRLCMNWLAKNYPDVVRKNIKLIPEYGRWDDLYCLFNTPVEKDALQLIKEQLALDIRDMQEGKNGISLLGKWAKSINCSSKESKQIGEKLRNYLNMTHKQYRKTLSALRSQINIVEKLMSENRWDEIEFSKLPSRAGFIYRNAFARNEIIGEKYRNFIESKQKVNAGTLYPYDVVKQATCRYPCAIGSVEREAINKYWENLPDYLNGEPCKILCVVDTSGSMTGSWNSTIRPIDIAIGLGMYCAERVGGDFKNKYISFSSRPQWIDIKGMDFVDKAQRIYRTNLCENTDLQATLNLVKNTMKQSDPKDWPTSLVIISDLQIDAMVDFHPSTEKIKTDMEKYRQTWELEGLPFPKVYYWNVNAVNPTILDDGPNISYVSGASPVLFQQILRGVSGWELCLEKLNSERYSAIRV